MTMMDQVKSQDVRDDLHGGLAVSLPAWAYTNNELVDLEYERVILPSWQFVCHVSQVRNPGDYATLDLKRDSILVMRGKDNELRAFMNVCRHRAAKLLDGTGNSKARITCTYHGWSYDTQGALKGIPAEKTFPGIEKEKLGLKEVEFEILSGLIFARIIPGGPTLRESFGEMAEVIEAYRLEDMEPAGPAWVETWNCNWKVAVDNNLENYHITIGHPGLNRMFDSDLTGTINQHGIAYSKSVLKGTPSPNRAERMYQHLAKDALQHLPEDVRKTWTFFSLAPNIGLDIYPDSFDIFQILPQSGETCVMRYPIYARKDASREVKAMQWLNARINRQVGLEDRELCERVQLGLGSHGYEPGPLSNYEHAVVDFHDRIRAACPVVNEPQAPASGSVRRRNDALLTGERSAA
jgi:phenylpropionate dioxygenase-like ring-hydroxylating dioxygenase large terminal subunit